MLGFDNLHKANAGIPRVFFTHGNYLRDYTGRGYDSKVDFRGKKIVLLVRDPRDVAVSQYFQWNFRMRPNKKLLNDYPPHGQEMSIFQFMLYREQGLPQVIRYFNGWLTGIERAGRRAGGALRRHATEPAPGAGGYSRIYRHPGLAEASQRCRGFCRVRQPEEDGDGPVFFVAAGRLAAAAGRQIQSGFLQGPPRQGGRLSGLLQ